MLQKIRLLIGIILLSMFSGCGSETEEEQIPLPVSPTNLIALQISATQVNLTWSDNSTNETGYKIERKQNSGVYSVLATVNADITTYSDISVTLGETYTYRVYSFNKTGNSTTYSNEGTVTVEGTPILTTTLATSITKVSAISGGTITNGGGSTITERGVCWSTNQTPTVNDNKLSNGTGLGSYTCNLTGLSLGTTYYVRAYATNSSGTSYGNTISFTTEQNQYGSMTDNRDGNVYKTIAIGTQVWLAENLKYIPSVVGAATISISIPYYYVYGFNGTNVTDAKATSNYNTYGVLYNWAAAVSACPTGWHTPSNAEWAELINYLGGENVAGGKLKEAGETHWFGPNTGATNESGFTALPGGNSYNTFSNLKFRGSWWTATENLTTDAYRWNVDYSNTLARNYPGSFKKEYGYSVRCIKD